VNRLIQLAFCSAAIFAGFARTAEADASKCVAPSFSYDLAAALQSCTQRLNEDELSGSERARILTLRGRSLKINHQLKEAIRDFDAALALRPNEVETLVMRGWAAVDARDLDLALDFADRILAADPDNVDAYDIKGVVAHGRGDYTAELGFYDKAIALHPNNILARFNRLIFYKLQGYARGVIAEADAILALKTTDLDTLYSTLEHKRMTFRTQTRLERALAVERLGRTDRTEKAFADWIAVEPGAVSYGYRAAFRVRLDHFDDAFDDLDRALRDDPKFWLLHYTKGEALLFSNQKEEAVEAYSRAIELNPESGAAYWRRAMAERWLSLHDAALRDALKAVAIDPATREDKIRKLTRLGYFEVSPNDVKNPLLALADAVQACMADERCW
jgi:tetratricopeptide (TPR) repeat protein